MEPQPLGEPQRPGSGSPLLDRRGSGDQMNAFGSVQNINHGNGGQVLYNFITNNNGVAPAPSTAAPTADIHDCLRSLAFPSMDRRMNNISEMTPGTGQWLLEHEQYVAWASSNHGLLRIEGKPGSGKSTLLRQVVDTAEDLNRRVLSFFFHSRGDGLERTPLGLYRSLLHQIGKTQPGALSDVESIFKERSANRGQHGVDWDWHEGELKDLLALSLAKATEAGPFWLFIDALDESGDDAARLLPYLRSLMQRSARNLHICITCRPYQNLPAQPTEYRIAIDHENDRDISTHVYHALSLPIFHNGGPAIPEFIIANANNVFLWASLVIEKALAHERAGKTAKAIKDDILQTPKELGELYRELNGRIIEQGDPLSLKLIQWVCFACRPLHIQECRWAMMIDFDSPSYQSWRECEEDNPFPSAAEDIEKRLRTLSCGLVEVIQASLGDKSATEDSSSVLSVSSAKSSSDEPPLEKRMFVQFIHQSTRDFFISEGHTILANAMAKSAQGCDSTIELEAMAHYRLSRSCVRYLAMDVDQCDEFEPHELSLAGPNFVNYSVTNWWYHAERCQGSVVWNIADLLQDFGWPSEKLARRIPAMYSSSRYASNKYREQPLLLVACRHKLTGLLREILRRTKQNHAALYIKDPDGRTALSIAAELGYYDGVELILGAHTSYIDMLPTTLLRRLLRGKDNLVESADTQKQTPLHWAASSGDPALVGLLLERGASVDALDANQMSPLSWASYQDHLAVIHLLLENGARVDGHIEGRSAPLDMASGNGHLEAVRLLLEKGAQAEVSNSIMSPLFEASTRSGHLGIVQLLLDKGAQVDTPVWAKQTPLHGASWGGHLDIVQLLLDKGAQVDAGSEYGKTPLHMMCEFGHSGIVQLLLEKGAQVNATTKDGKTPLHMACERGHLGIVRLLLEKGAQVNATTKDGVTPILLAASGAGLPPVVEILLDNGADVDATDTEDGRTLLHQAIEAGRWRLVELLLAKGANVDKGDNDGSTPLTSALTLGITESAPLLLRYGADVNLTDNDGHSAMFYAIKNGAAGVVSLLLDHGACVDLADGDGRTPLFHAVQGRYTGVATVLLERGAWVDARDRYGWTALFMSFSRGNRPMVDLLLTWGASMEGCDDAGQMMFHKAVMDNSQRMADMLVSKEADVNCVDAHGQTPLFLAAYLGHVEVLQLLLSNGARVDDGDADGLTTLLAAEKGRREFSTKFQHIVDSSTAEDPTARNKARRFLEREGHQYAHIAHILRRVQVEPDDAADPQCAMEQGTEGDTGTDDESFDGRGITQQAMEEYLTGAATYVKTELAQIQWDKGWWTLRKRRMHSYRETQKPFCSRRSIWPSPVLRMKAGLAQREGDER